MNEPRVLVVAESLSLGRALVDLLDVAGLPARICQDPMLEGPLASFSLRFPVVVVGSPGFYCETARRWLRGRLPPIPLIVVGSNDPQLPEDHRMYRFPLPLATEEFLRVVRAHWPGGGESAGAPPGSSSDAGARASPPEPELRSP